MKNLDIAIMAALAAAALGGCTGSVQTGTGRMGVDGPLGMAPPTTDTPSVEETEAGGREDTFDHPSALGGSAVGVREALQRMVDEGPPLYAARTHSCRKVRYATLGRILASRGVNLDAEGETAAGQMWRSADQALGSPNYGARIAETTDPTVAVESRMFDIFVQAAPEIIASMPTRPECQIGGVGVRLFDDIGTCNADGISCLLGTAATDTHVALCNDVVSRATTPEAGRILAVAAMLAAANTCE